MAKHVRAFVGKDEACPSALKQSVADRFFSSVRKRRPMVGCVCAKVRAAAASVPSRATARKTRRSLHSISLPTLRAITMQ